MNYPRCISYLIDWAASVICPANFVAFLILLFDGNRYYIYKAWVELALWIEFFLMQVPCFFHFYFNGIADIGVGCVLFYIPRMSLWTLTFMNFDTGAFAWMAPPRYIYRKKTTPPAGYTFIDGILDKNREKVI